MARTTRRRDPNEVVNFNRSTKKNDRRNNTKKRIQEIDYTNPDRLDEFDDDDDNEVYVKGYN